MADLLDEEIERLKTEQRAGAELSVSALQSYNVNPDQYAKQKQIAQKTGNPAYKMPELSDEAKLRMVVDNFEETAKVAPRTARWLANPDNAKLAHDDTGNLAQIDDRIGSISALRGSTPTVSNVIKGLLQSFGQGVSATKEGLVQQISDALGWESISKEARQNAAGIQMDITASTPAFESSTASGLYGGASSLARLLPATAASIFTRSAAPVLTVAGLQTQAEAYSKYRLRRGDKLESFLGASAEGALEVGTELLPMKFLVESLGKTGMKKFMAGFLGRELASEEIATFTQDAVDTAIANPDKTWTQYLQERPDAAYQTALGTLVQTGFFGAMNRGLEHINKKAVEAERSIAAADIISQMGKLVKASKVAGRDGGAFQSFIDQAFEGSPIQNVFIKADVLAQSGLAEQLATVSPSVAAQFAEAVVTGAEIRIPVSEYMSNVAPTELNEVLLDDLRIEGEDMTRREAAVFIESYQDELVKTVEQQKMTDEQHKEFTKSANEVHKTIFDQLSTTGIYAAPVARAYASMVRDFYVTQAANMGVLPMELYEAYPYKVVAGEIGQGDVAQNQVVTETPEFKNWFGDSKAVDESGKPLVVYHGTGNPIDTPFITPAYFTENPGPTDRDVETYRERYNKKHPDRVLSQEDALEDLLSGLSSASSFAQKEGGRIFPVYLKIENPVPFMGPEIISLPYEQEWVDKQVSLGYDGAVGQDHTGQTIWVAFRPEQIKSATGNRGTFDPGDPNILHQSEAIDKTWRNWEPKITSTGKIKGSPEWVNSAADLDTMRRTLRKFVKEGFSGRMWYENSAAAIMRMVKNDVVKAEKFIQLIAIYSPNSNVWVNTIQAVRAYTHWAAGLSAETLSVGSEKADAKTIDVLYKNEPFEGRKTNSFYLNLMHSIVENHPDQISKLNLDPGFVEELSLPVTIDVWMGRAFGYDNTAFENDKGTGKYSFAENEIRRLTARLNADIPEGGARWTPHQVQAAIWTAMKTRFEIPAVKEKTNRKSLKEGLITLVNGRPFYPGTANERRLHMVNWRHFAMQPTSDEVRQKAEETGRSFGDDLGRMTDTVTWEAIPSTSVGAEINNASPEAKALFTAAANQLLTDEHGADLLAHQLGVPLSFSNLGYGAYAGAVNPNVLSHMLPARGKGEGFSVDEVRAYAKAIQYIFKQDAVPWFRIENKALTSDLAKKEQAFRVINNKTGKTLRIIETQAEAMDFAAEKGADVRIQGGNLARGVVVKFNKSLDSAALGGILKSLQEYLGEDAGFTRTAADEITVINYRDDHSKIPFARTDEEFIDAVGLFGDENRQSLGITDAYRVWAEGEYGYVHNWEEDSEGRRILDSGSLSGRPDLQGWVRGRRNEFEKLLTEFSGKGLSAVEEADAGKVLFQSKKQTGGLSAVGVHYSAKPRESLDSSFFGKGAPSTEAGRLAGNPDLQDRINFYVNSGKGISPESYFDGTQAHTAQLENIYDATVDPLNLRAGKSANDFERAVMKAGFNGYLDRPYGVAIMLGKRNVPVTPASDTSNIPAIEGPKYSPAQLLSQELAHDDRLPAGMMTGPEWVKEIKTEAPDVYRRLKEMGLIDPLKAEKSKIKRASIPLVGEKANTSYQNSPEQKAATAQAEQQLGILEQKALTWGGARVLETAHMLKDMKMKKSTELIGKRVKSPEDLALLASIYRNKSFETFRAFYVVAGKIVSSVGWTSAMPGFAMIPPTVIKTVSFTADLLEQAHPGKMVSIYLLHNHPSGNIAVSSPDVNLTKVMANGGPSMGQDIKGDSRIVGHVVIDHGKYSFIDTEGNALAFSIKKLQGKEDPLGGIKAQGPHLGRGVASSDGVASVGKDFHDSAHVVVGLNSKGEVTAVLDIPTNWIRDYIINPKQVTKRFQNQFRQHGIGMPTLWLNQCPSFREFEALRGMVEADLVVDAAWEMPSGTVESIRNFTHTRPGFTAGQLISEYQAIMVKEERASLAQRQQGGNRRAGFNPSTLTTILTQQSDYSSFLHETAHFFLTTYAKMASSPNATPKVKEDMQTLLSWFGVPDLATWNGMSLEEQRKHHEAFAYNYETYLFEGKSPDPKMQGVFERFSAWLKRIYISIRDELNQIYRQEHGVDLPILTGEVRQVMDRMLASDEQIKQAENIRGMTPLFLDQATSGMTNEEWAAYQEMQQEAHEASLSEHRTASLRQMKWVGNAKSRVLKSLQATTRALRRAIMIEVTEAVNAMPIYQAQHALKGASEIEALAIADSLGYSSVEDLKLAIANAPKKATTIREETDQRMLNEHGELTDPKAMAAAVDRAVHNEARARFIGVELRHLAKSQRPVRVMQEAARQAARAILGKRAIKDIRPHDYAAAEAKAAAAAEKAMKEGDTATATQAKEHQLLQNQLASEALRANGEIDKATENFKKVFAADKRLGKSRDMNYVNVARAILAHYGFGTSDLPASAYLAKIKAYDPEFFAEIEPMITAHQLQAKPLKNLTLDEFADLHEQVQALWHMSRRNKQIEIDGELRDRQEVVTELDDAIRGFDSTGRAGYTSAVTKWQETKIKLMGMRAAMRRVEAWVDAMDRGSTTGPFRRYIWNPISEAVTAYRMAKADYMTKYLELLKTAEPLLRGKNVVATELNYTFTPQELLHAILHTGNESNRKKLLVGREWGAVDENGVLDAKKWDAFIARAQKEGLLTKAHYDFAQQVWDLMEQMKPAAQKAHRQMYGFYFNEITATPFTTPFGTYAGGYVPAVTDPNIVTDATMRNEQETQLVDNSFMFPTTGRGFTKGRVEYNKPLLLNLGYLASHMDKVLRFTHIEPKVKDVARVVKTNRSFASAMDELDPTVRGDMLVPWLQRTAMQMVSMPAKGWGGRAADSVFRYLRTNTGMQMMVANVTNTLQQFTGISISALKVRPTLLRNALWQYIRQPGDTAQMVIDKSDYMKTRMNSDQYELQRTMDELLLNPSKYEKLQEFAAKHGYFMQQATQGVVDTITWAGAYNQAIENGVDEKAAVREADAAVRMTQGSFAPEDVSRIETGSAFMRAFTHFYSYFNMQANILGTEFLNVARNMGVKAGAGKMLYVYFFGFMVPAVLSEMIVQAAGGFDAGDDDEYDLWDAMRLFFGAQARPIAAMMPGVGPAVIAGFNTFNSKPYDDRLSTSPAVSAIEASVRAPHSVYAAIAGEGSWSRATKDFLTGLGMITRLPLGQIAKPIGYGLDVAQGKAEPEGAMDVARGVLSGKDVNRKQ